MLVRPVTKKAPSGAFWNLVGGAGFEPATLAV